MLSLLKSMESSTSKEIALELTQIAREIVASENRKRIAARFVLYHRFGTSESQRKPIKKGTLSVLNRWAEKQGFEWKKNSSLFGGYWVDPGSRDNYEFDTV